MRAAKRIRAASRFGIEELQRPLRVVDAQTKGLADQMRRVKGGDQREERAEMAERAGREHQDDRGQVEDHDPGRRGLSEPPGGGPHPGECIVFQVLHRIDGVVAERQKTPAA